MFLDKPRSLKVPLGSVRPGELFAVHVSLEAEAVDDRGGESAAQAFIQDPQKRQHGLLLTAHGLEPRGGPRFEEPPAEALQPATCPRGIAAQRGRDAAERPRLYTSTSPSARRWSWSPAPAALAEAPASR